MGEVLGFLYIRYSASFSGRLFDLIILELGQREPSRTFFMINLLPLPRFECSKPWLISIILLFCTFTEKNYKFVYRAKQLLYKKYRAKILYLIQKLSCAQACFWGPLQRHRFTDLNEKSGLVTVICYYSIVLKKLNFHELAASNSVQYIAI